VLDALELVLELGALLVDERLVARDAFLGAPT
jgi:hypothetical protein